ncbi:MAG: hypothetical protein MK329_14265, partial [Pirellulales bacterium]|nr:hypothetical protein [Pirellulales bacterium]
VKITKSQLLGIEVGFFVNYSVEENTVDRQIFSYRSCTVGVWAYWSGSGVQITVLSLLYAKRGNGD